jgi:AcrR family transcriptional regulator
MLTTPNDFKQQMVEARRTQILLGAAEVFAEKGFHKATTREIARRAGISEGTIYNYFDNKRELLLALIELLGLRSLKEIIGGELPDDPRELFNAVVADRYKLIEERGYLIAPIIAEIFADAELRELVYQKLLLSISGYLEKYVQTQIDAGRFRQMDPIIVTRAFIGMIVINFALKLADVDPRYEKISAQSLNRQLVSLMLDGLLSDEARNKENGASQAEK